MFDAEKDQGENETILLVGYEQSVLSILQTVLQTNGYTTLTATTPEEAVRVAVERPVDLLIAPLLGATSGADLADAIRARYPHLETLFTQPYDGDAVQLAPLMRGRSVLRIPYSPAQLLRKVREVLDEGRTATHPAAGKDVINFIIACFENPLDEVDWLVLADRLEDEGHPIVPSCATSSEGAGNAGRRGPSRGMTSPASTWMVEPPSSPSTSTARCGSTIRGHSDAASFA